MKRRNLIHAVLLVFILLTSMYVLSSSSNSSANHEGPCPETLQDCCEARNNGKLIWEELPSQFYSQF